MTTVAHNTNRRIYVAASAIIVIGLIYQVMRQEVALQSTETLEYSSVDQSVELRADDELSAAKEALRQAQAILQTSAIQSPVAPDEVVMPDAIRSSNPSLWHIADERALTPSMPLPNAVTLYEPILFDELMSDYPVPGQQTSVNLPGGERLSVDVKTATRNPNGDYTWAGHLEGYGDAYPVVMTYGGNTVFATITTPKGSYTMESVNGSGWVYKNPSEFELSNPGVDDFLEIPHEHN